MHLQKFIPDIGNFFRATYGVVLITTKTPHKNSEPQFSDNSSYIFNRQTYFPKYLNSIEYLTILLEADRTGKDGGIPDGEPFTDLELATKHFNDPANNSTIYPSPIYPNKYRYVGNIDWIRCTLLE